MATNHRKRRLSSTIQEQSRAKKREFKSLQYEFDTNSHASLKWDDNDKTVVAIEEQIGISPRHLSQFVHVSGSAKLADVVAVSKEVFELDDMAEILTYEDWKSVLTDKERSFLARFLPQGFEPDEVVQALLGGENFHFGNPFLKWGSSLCTGDLHPDAVVQYEKSFKAKKKAYYSELQQYHDTMIMNLLKLKERCGSSKDRESEILKIMSRSKGHAEKNVLPDSNAFKFQNLEANAIYESTSSIADDKSYYSDNQKLSVIRDAEIQKRIRNQELLKDKHEKWSSSPDGLKGLQRPKKAEKFPKINISNGGSKYMSYVKISKKQHEELVRSMGQSGPIILPKNLNRLLGNLDSYNVKPYEMFGEEEQKRIHEHWANLVNKDLPAFLQKWRRGQLERLQIMNYLCQEIEDKLGPSTETQNEFSVKPFNEGFADAQDVEGVESQGTSEDHHDNKSATQCSVSDGDNNTQCSSQNETSNQSLPLNINGDFDPSSNINEDFDVSSMEIQSLKIRPLNVNEDFDPSSMGNQSLHGSLLNINEEFCSSSMKDKSLTSNSPLDDNQEFNHMHLDEENNQVSSETSDTCSPPEQQVVQTSEASVAVSHTETHSSGSADKIMEIPGSSVKNIWSSVSLPASYDFAQSTTQFASSGEMTVRHVQSEQSAHLMNLESDLPKGATNHMPFINPYLNRERNEPVLQSLIKRDIFHQEQKRSGLPFLPSNVLLEPDQFPSHIQEHLQPSFVVDHRQREQSELFMNQNIRDSIYSDNNRYSISGQAHLSAINMRDWDSHRMSNPVQPQLSSRGQLNHSLFVYDNGAHGGWSAPEGPAFSTTSVGSGSSDQTLYSVLLQCNSVQSRPQFNHVSSAELMMIPSTRYGQDMATGVPMTSNSLSQTSTTCLFDY